MVPNPSPDQINPFPMFSVHIDPPTTKQTCRPQVAILDCVYAPSPNDHSIAKPRPFNHDCCVFAIIAEHFNKQNSAIIN